MPTQMTGPRRVQRNKKMALPRAPKQRPSRNMSLEARKELIVRLSAPYFLDKGYDNVTMNDIILAAGGSKATIYSLFGSKEGLFDEVVRLMASEVSVSIEVNAPGTIEEQLRQLGRSFLVLILHPKVLEFHRLMVSMGKSFPAKSKLFYEAGPLSAAQNVAGWIARHQKSGALRAGDSYDLAVLFMDMLIGQHQLAMLTNQILHVSEAEIDRKVDNAVRMFLRGCSK